ncbi:9932_t:CDS:2 [Dentiscutata heterogama]|uniref:9932_t:CDS:1 n=1 Tax=Dentiscutata heterogama TaxID=1316150 RepID=A0ACA9NXB9_9GLOM|nr:9932_t:CDS:2 [Dentiscutata heterogama]
MSFQSNLVEIANSLTDHDAENLIKILQSRLDKKSHIPSPPPLYIAPSSFDFFSKGFHSCVDITFETFFDLVNDFKINGNFLRYTWDRRSPCPLCKRPGYHTCCSRCKNLDNECNCEYACGLSFPVQYSPSGKVSSWKKCSFVTNNYDKKAMFRHLRTCEGKISQDLKLTILKGYKHPKKKGSTITIPEEINLNERYCIFCKETHDMRQACHGENLGCWSSNTTLVDLPLTMSNHANDTGKRVWWGD